MCSYSSNSQRILCFKSSDGNKLFDNNNSFHSQFRLERDSKINALVNMILNRT